MTNIFNVLSSQNLSNQCTYNFCVWNNKKLMYNNEVQTNFDIAFNLTVQ